MNQNSERVRALKIETSLYNLTKICFEKCTENKDFYEMSQYSQEQNKDLYKNFEKCLKNCTVAMTQTRDYIKFKLIQDIDETANKNDEIYKDFYK